MTLKCLVASDPNPEILGHVVDMGSGILCCPNLTNFQVLLLSTSRMLVTVLNEKNQYFTLGV